MKTDITNTKLWAEFLEWMKIIINKPTPETQIFSIEIMPLIFIKNETNRNSLLLRYGALIGLLEQFLWDKDKTFFNVATNMIKKFSCMVFALNEDAYHSKGEFDNPLLAKSEAIYQYFKSKG